MRRSRFAGYRACLAGWLALLAAAAAICLHDGLRVAFLGQAMLLTQKSPQTLCGALRAAGTPVLCSVWLSLLRAAVFFWLPPLIAVADTMAFGTPGGILAAWTGNLAAAACCFALSRLLLGPLVQSWLSLSAQRRAARWGGTLACALVLCLPGLGGLAGYLLGCTGLSWRRYLAGIAPAELAVAACFGLCCSPYQTALPSGAALALRLAALLVLAVNALYLRQHHT